MIDHVLKKRKLGLVIYSQKGDTGDTFHYQKMINIMEENRMLVTLTVQELESYMREWFLDELKRFMNQHAKENSQFTDLPEMITRKQAAKMIGVSVTTLDMWTREGRLRKHRIGRTVRFKRDELIASFKSLKDSRYQR